jgi:hypothetical protein
MNQLPAFLQSSGIAHSLPTAETKWDFKIINVYTKLFILKENSRVCLRQKRIPLNSTDDVFMHEYFLTTSDEFTHKYSSIRWSLRVPYNCPLSKRWMEYIKNDDDEVEEWLK